jgi:hypothetical protein
VRLKYPTRLAAIAGLCTVLAIFVGVNALSNTKFADDPSGAIALNPSNGLARANLAFDQFDASVRDWSPSETSDPQAMAAEAMETIVKAATDASGEARRAYQLDPLTPKAHAILALAAPNLEFKNEIIDIASGLSKRQLVLQGLLFEKHIAEGSYTKTIDTLDQILRVYPEVSNRFLPNLVEVLILDDTLPQFADLFANPLPWRQQFLNLALKDGRALRNLAVLRSQVVLDDENFDKRLISRLVEQGDLASARSVYQVAKPISQNDHHFGRLDWQSDFPPIEWRLASERGMRAEVVEAGSALMLDVAPGRGGVLASRLINPPNSRFSVRIDHDLKLASRPDQLTLRLVCFPNNQVVLDRQLADNTEQFIVNPMISGCNAYVIEIAARVWTDSSVLQGKIFSVSLTE